MLCHSVRFFSFISCCASVLSAYTIFFLLKYLDRQASANSVDSDQTPECGIQLGSALFATHPPYLFCYKMGAYPSDITTNIISLK